MTVKKSSHPQDEAPVSSEHLIGAEGTLTEKAKIAAESADDFVHRNPWEAVGVAAGLGLLIGLFIGRR
ncbi:MAG: hypothetical protein B7Z19_04755 [Polynucleobacter sp. 32-46-5]|nr:MAG: hypothetical protein B7Z19_04755 [Polynucleobacter sp. 32-46-5]